jgi:hypothetical protein
MNIVIEAGNVKAKGSLTDTETARKIIDILPFEASAMTWGDEIYFEIPVWHERDETSSETVELGDLGYWPTGRAFCIFFGPTPMSSNNEIRPASAVNVVGQIDGDPTVFKKVKAGDSVRISLAD